MLPPNHYLAPRIPALPADGSMQQEEDCSPSQCHLHHCDNFCRASRIRIPTTGQRTRKTRLGIPAPPLTSSVDLGLATPSPWATVFSSAITSRTMQHPLTGLLVSPVNFTVLCQCWLLASMFPSVQRECIQLFSNSFSPGIFDVSNSKLRSAVWNTLWSPVTWVYNPDSATCSVTLAKPLHFSAAMKLG